MLHNKKIGIVFGWMISSMGYTAEETALPPVYVTESGTDDPAGAAVVTQTILDRDAIAKSEERDLNGVLRGLPGLSLQSTGMRTTLSGLSVRGTNAGLGQLTLDGVPLYSAVAGAYNLGIVPADGIQKVELTRGALAPRYGSRALGGVIRLSSRDEKQTGAFAHIEGGSYGTLSETFGGSWAGPRFRGTVTASRDDIFDGASASERAYGNREGDDFWSHQVLARMNAEPADSLHVNSTLLYSRARADLDAPGLLPTGLIGLMDDLTGSSMVENWMAQTTAALDIAQSWSSALQLGYTSGRGSNRSLGQRNGFDQRLFMARWTNTHAFTVPETAHSAEAGLNFVWGGELRQEEGRNLVQFPGIDQSGRRTTLSGVVELQAQLGAWSALAGSTIDHYEDYGTNPTFYAGFNGPLLDTLKLRASGGYGYRAPAFQELFFFPAFGNPALRPEHGWSGDLGLDWQPRGDFRTSVTGFYSRYRDLIQVELASTNPLLAKALNVPQAEIWGFELESQKTWEQGLTAGINYTFTHSEDRATGNALMRVPQHQGRVYGEWRLPTLPVTLWVETVYHGGYFQDQAQLLHASEVVRINAQVGYRLSPQWQLYVRGENLADDRTEELFSFANRGATVFAGFRGSL